MISGNYVIGLAIFRTFQEDPEMGRDNRISIKNEFFYSRMPLDS